MIVDVVLNPADFDDDATQGQVADKIAAEYGLPLDRAEALAARIIQDEPVEERVYF